MKWILFCLCFVGCLVGCGEKLEPLDVTMTLKAYRAQDEGLLFVGETNLPERTILSFHLDREPDAEDIEFWRVADLCVREGRFHTKSFRYQGKRLPPGTYTVTLWLGIIVEQPESVLARIGDKGQALRGPLTQKAKFLGKTIRTVEYTQTFLVQSVAEEVLEELTDELIQEIRSLQEVLEE